MAPPSPQHRADRVGMLEPAQQVGSGSQAGNIAPFCWRQGHRLQTFSPRRMGPMRGQSRWGSTSSNGSTILQLAANFGVLPESIDSDQSFHSSIRVFSELGARLSGSGESVDAAKAGSVTSANAILRSLRARIAVLDPHGVIVEVNDAWRNFARGHGAESTGGRGASYLHVCDQAAKEGDEIARAAADGIRAVLQGETPEFTLEYPWQPSGS